MLVSPDCHCLLGLQEVVERVESLDHAWREDRVQVTCRLICIILPVQFVLVPGCALCDRWRMIQALIHQQIKSILQHLAAEMSGPGALQQV